MTDKNGTEIRTGDIVEITGAYFKNDNGLYFVQASPGDPHWSGSDHSLIKISKAGKISKARHNLCFWPPVALTSNRVKNAEARTWNAEHAQIEIKGVRNMDEVAVFFQEKADSLQRIVTREIWDFGKDSDVVKKDQAMVDFCKAVAARVKGGADGESQTARSEV